MLTLDIVTASVAALPELSRQSTCLVWPNLVDRSSTEFKWPIFDRIQLAEKIYSQWWDHWMWFGCPSNQTQDVDKAVTRLSKCCYGHLFVRWKPVSALQANPMSQSYKRSPEAVRAETVQKWSRESQRVPEVRAEDVTLVRAEAVKMWSQQYVHCLVKAEMSQVKSRQVYDF